MIIGICGKSGSGKSTIARSLLESIEESIHLDIDKIGHEVLKIKDVQDKLVNYFGQNIIKENIIDRKKLSKIVFSSRKKMKILEEITWGHMQKKINDTINKNNDKIIVLDWILLPKSHYFNICNIKILVNVPFETRKKRIIKRDGITSEQFDLREKASINYSNKMFDYIIDSDYDINELRKQVLT